eukprot:gene36746-45329_t
MALHPDSQANCKLLSNAGFGRATTHLTRPSSACVAIVHGTLPICRNRRCAMSSVLKRNNVKVLGDEGPVLMYAHGFGCNQDMWSLITPAFRATHRQVLFDYVGSGGTDRTAFARMRYADLRGYALDVLEVCDALGLSEGVTFVGHSVSCSIGMLASIERPSLFDRLILLGPSPCFLNDPPGYAGGFERDDLEGLLALMDQNYMGWANYPAPLRPSRLTISPGLTCRSTPCSTWLLP